MQDRVHRGVHLLTPLLSVGQEVMRHEEVEFLVDEIHQQDVELVHHLRRGPKSQLDRCDGAGREA